MGNQILLVTTRRSSHSNEIVNHLNEIGFKSVRLNTDEIVENKYHEAILSNINRSVIKIKNELIKIDEIISIWWDEIVCSFPDTEYSKWAKLETEKGLLWILSSLATKYINDPFNIISASNKLSQLKYAIRKGIKIPETLITNNFDRIKSHFKRDFIYKPMSRPTPNSVGDDKAILTNLVNKSDLTRDSISCKLSLFQEYIDKQYEVRIITVANVCFAVSIHNQESNISNIDWRNYDFANTPHYPIELPNKILTFCKSITNNFGLVYSAIDMIVNTKGDFVFLEMNPQGLWLWLEKLTGLKITKQIAIELSKKN